MSSPPFHFDLIFPFWAPGPHLLICHSQHNTLEHVILVLTNLLPASTGFLPIWLLSKWNLKLVPSECF